jgi:hypothetical protein
MEENATVAGNNHIKLKASNFMRVVTSTNAFKSARQVFQPFASEIPESTRIYALLISA